MGMVNLKSYKMTARNVNVDEFINILVGMSNNGVKLVTLDMVPDDNYPEMNKIIIHPHPVNGTDTNNSTSQSTERYERPRNLFIRNPNIKKDSDDIFNLFNGIV